MKIHARSLTLCFAMAIVLSGAALWNVAAQDANITPQQIEQIRGNCVSLKNTLNQLHVSDALLRVNMGQRYELMSTKLMDRFNSRVSSNNLSNIGLVFVSNGYKTALDVFRSDYKTYEENLSATIKINCDSQPSAFYEAIVTARANRSQVHTDIVNLNQFIDQYQSAVIQFEQNYQTVATGVKN